MRGAGSKNTTAAKTGAKQLRQSIIIIKGSAGPEQKAALAIPKEQSKCMYRKNRAENKSSSWSGDD
jgi:hypothetical protein